MPKSGTTLAVLHDEGQVGQQWCDFIQNMFTEELPEECRDLNLDVLTESVDYIGEDEACNVNNCEYKLLLLNSEVLKFLKNPESPLRRSEMLETKPEHLIILILGQEDDVAFLQTVNSCIFGFKDHESYNIIKAKFPEQIFSDIMAILSPMYVVPHPNILSSEDKDQHLTLISNKPYPVAQEMEYIVELSVGRKTVETTASLFNPCTLLVQNPGHTPGVVTLKIFACTRNPHTEDKIPEVTRTQIGEDMKVWFQSGLDRVYSILEAQSNPMSFLCQAMNISYRGDSVNRNVEEKIDTLLTESFKKSIPPNKLSLVFGNAQHLEDQDGNRPEYIPTLLHFSALYGLRDLTAALLQCPGAVEAYGTANCDGDYPTNLAEKSGHWDLCEFMQTYMEVAAMVHNEFGDKGRMQTSQIVSSMAHGQYLSFGFEDDSDEIYTRMNDGAKKFPMMTTNTPGYLAMSPLQSLPGMPMETDYDIIQKVLEGSDENYYEMLELPSYHRPPPSPPKVPLSAIPDENYSAEVPPPPPPRDDHMQGSGLKENALEPKDDLFLLPKLPSDLSPAQQELISLQKKVKNNELTINQAVFRFKEWERKHKERAASFQYQQENLQRIRNSLMRSKEEKKQRGESTSIRISEPLTAGTSTYDKVLLKTRQAVMDATYGGVEDLKGKRPSLERKNGENFNPGNIYSPERQTFTRMRESFKSSFGRPPMSIPDNSKPLSRASRGSQGSSISSTSSRSSVSSTDSSSYPMPFNRVPSFPQKPLMGIPKRRTSSPGENTYRLPGPRMNNITERPMVQDRMMGCEPAPPVPPRDSGQPRKSHTLGYHTTYSGPDAPPQIPPRNPNYR